MALDELGDEGVRLNVNVYDSKASENTVRDLLRTDPDLPNSHLIVGPYRRQNVQKVADYAKKENITFISPYSASASFPSLLLVSTLVTSFHKTYSFSFSDLHPFHYFLKAFFYPHCHCQTRPSHP